jgi:hypothetical protein
MQLIGLTGRSGAGKNTAADYLEKAHGYHRMALADPIKEALQVMLGLTHNQVYGDSREVPLDWLHGFTPRALLQTLGTEWGRCLVHPDIWITCLFRRLEQAAVERVVITDVRFDNEVHAIHARGGAVWAIERPRAPKNKTVDHVSEGGVAADLVDAVIQNTGTVAQLHNALAALF